LAWALLDALGALKLERATGLDADLKRRFDLLATSTGRAGLLARVYLVRALAYLDWIDPQWTEQRFWSRLSWSHPEASSLWQSYAHSNVGSPRLFNALKLATLEAVEQRHVPDDAVEAIVSKLLNICICHRRGEALEYNLSSGEMRRLLTVCQLSARRNTSWNLWRFMGDAQAEPVDKASRWHKVVGPIFQSIWPLDARLRSQDTTRYLVLMALECQGAFSEAVDAIIDLIVPYELHQISISLKLEDTHRELVHQDPLSFLKLTNALVDATLFSIPNDLAEFLQECVAADPTVVAHPAYVRLNGLRRQRNA
jgi:hypothetical protein